MLFFIFFIIFALKYAMQFFGCHIWDGREKAKLFCSVTVNRKDRLVGKIGFVLFNVS